MREKTKKVLKELRGNRHDRPPKVEKVDNHTEVYFPNERGKNRLEKNFKSSGSSK